MAHALSGACLCGAVRFTATVEKLQMDACHCAMCRRWSGGVWFTVLAQSVAFESEADVAAFASSDWAERCFCRTCGSTLMWRMKDHSMITVSAQAFDDPAQFHFHDEIFIEEKPANYAFANDTNKLTGEEVLASIQSGQDIPNG